MDKDYPAVYLNKALYKLAGYNSMTEMLTATHGEMKNMIYAADLPKLKKVMATHCGSEPYTINYRLLRKDGTAVWVLERTRAVYADGRRRRLLYLHHRPADAGAGQL